jgi:hypothetical protein
VKVPEESSVSRAVVAENQSERSKVKRRRGGSLLAERLNRPSFVSRLTTNFIPTLRLETHMLGGLLKEVEYKTTTVIFPTTPYIPAGRIPMSIDCVAEERRAKISFWFAHFDQPLFTYSGQGWDTDVIW